jgi:hypothetical protein
MKTVKNENQMPTEQELELRKWALAASQSLISRRSVRRFLDIKGADALMELAWKIFEFVHTGSTERCTELNFRELLSSHRSLCERALRDIVELKKKQGDHNPSAVQERDSSLEC